MMTGSIISSPSPNHDSRGGQPVDMLVLHYTGMQTGQGALARLCDADSRVSAHYVVEEDGRIFALVPESERAWHAGVASWHGHDNINARSIGIEIVNPGHQWGYRDFPQMQMDAVVALCKAILLRHEIPARNVVGHSDIAFRRKEDPGERFDWAMLAKHGIGIMPQSSDTGCDDAVLGLAAYGYGITAKDDKATVAQCITAFQRHFRPGQLNGAWDKQCSKLLASLLNQASLD